MMDDDLLPADPDLVPLHTRDYQVRAFKIDDGTILLRGAVRDTKPPGLYIDDDPEPLPIHHMVVDLTLAWPSLEITDAKAVFEVHPQSMCPDIAPAYDRLVGISIARGFNNRVRELFGGPRGCTHITALLAAYAVAQVCGGVIGVWITHLMFDLPLMQYSSKVRSGVPQWISECLATGVLLATIHLGLRNAAERVPLLVALIVTAGYWFTASTFFAYPAVTIARSFSNTFAGIQPADVAGFILMQLAATAIACTLLRSRRS